MNIKKEMKIIGILFIGALPIIMFLDLGLGVNLVSDHGWVKTIIFFVTVVWYGVMSEQASKINSKNSE